MDADAHPELQRSGSDVVVIARVRPTMPAWPQVIEIAHDGDAAAPPQSAGYGAIVSMFHCGADGSRSHRFDLRPLRSSARVARNVCQQCMHMIYLS